MNKNIGNDSYESTYIRSAMIRLLTAVATIITLTMTLLVGCGSSTALVPSKTPAEAQNTIPDSTLPPTSSPSAILPSATTPSTLPSPLTSSPIPPASPTPTPRPTMIVNRTTHGVIRWDETWRGEIKIVGDILVAPGYTLTIEPGTKVLISANSDVENLTTDPFYRGVHFGEPFRDEGNHISIRIMGTLRAVGTIERMITITSDSPTPGIYDWNYFGFENGTMSYCQLEYYRCLTPGNDTTLTFNKLLNVGEAAIACGKSSMLIEHNTISYAGHELIDMHGGAPTIRYNDLGPNPGHVGIIIDGGSPFIIDNDIKGCQFGVNFVSPPGNPTIKDNRFGENREDIHNFGDAFK